MNTWLGTHLDHKGINEIIKKLNGKSLQSKDKTDKKQESEQLQNIRKFIGVMKGLK